MISILVWNSSAYSQSIKLKSIEKCRFMISKHDTDRATQNFKNQTKQDGTHHFDKVGTIYDMVYCPKYYIKIRKYPLESL